MPMSHSLCPYHEEGSSRDRQGARAHSPDSRMGHNGNDDGDENSGDGDGNGDREEEHDDDHDGKDGDCEHTLNNHDGGEDETSP